MEDVLLFITLSFPYTKGKESSFINNELQVLATKYKEIIILPTMIAGDIDNIPDNCSVDISYANYINGLGQRNIINKFFRGFFSTFFFKEFAINITTYKSLRKIVSLALYTSKLIDRINWFNSYSRLDSINVVYTFWFTINTNAIAFSSKARFKQIITRAHGVDVYEFRNESNKFHRRLSLKNIKLVANISNNGRDYFRQEYPKFKEKFQTFYLGIRNLSNIRVYHKNDVFNVLSCSSVIKIKRVNQIYDVLNILSKREGIRINWTHIGDGNLFEELQSRCIESDNFKIDLKGGVTNNEVFEYYQNNDVDIFIHMSETEGLPVVMMEASSFGVPIISTNVGGVSEIVRDGETGFLLSPNPSNEEVVNKLFLFYKLSYKQKVQFRENSRKLWNKCFNADNCFDEFYNKITSL